MAGNQGPCGSVGAMEKCTIVAVSDNWAIGRAGDLPWHISEDLKYFKKTTLGCPVIMGRRTWESLPFKPLKGRRNIVLTHRDLPVEGVVCVESLKDAYAAAGEEPRCFVMGGASVYAAAMDSVDKLYVTHVHTVLDDADAFFPAVDENIWEVESRSELLHDEETGYDFEFVVYSRR